MTTTNNAGTPGSPQVTLAYAYDKDGNRATLTDTTDTTGTADSYEYNARNLLDFAAQSGSGANASSVAPELAFFNYDAASNLTSLTRYANTAATTKVATTTYAYDNAERLTAISHANAAGGAISSYAYTLDAANRLTSEAHAWNGGSSTDTVTYGYTNNNQLTAVTHSNSALANEAFSYDQNGNRNASGQTTITGNEISSDGTYNYVYDADGNLVKKTSIATGIATVNKWDYRNRLVEVDSVASGVTTVVAAFTYDAINRQIAETDYPALPPLGDASFETPALASGSSQATPTGTPWTFTGNSGVAASGSGFTTGNPAVPDGAQVGYLNGTAGLSQTVANWAAGTYTISFDAAQCGNYGGRQEDFRVLVDGSVVATFKPTGTAYQFFTATFTASAGSHTIALQGLDSAGGDNTALIDAVSLSGATSQRETVYDGQTPLLDYNGSGTLTARYLSVPGAIDELLARQTSSGVAWYLDDREGSVKDLINNSGTVLDHVDYTAYGQVAAESAPGQGDRFKYAGMEFDAAIGLYYDRARDYDPAAGRFIGQDPMGFNAGDANLYSYTGNNASNLIDPSGLQEAPPAIPTPEKPKNPIDQDPGKPTSPKPGDPGPSRGTGPFPPPAPVPPVNRPPATTPQNPSTDPDHQLDLIKKLCKLRRTGRGRLPEEDDINQELKTYLLKLRSDIRSTPNGDAKNKLKDRYKLIFDLSRDPCGDKQEPLGPDPEKPIRIRPR